MDDLLIHLDHGVRTLDIQLEVTPTPRQIKSKCSTAAGCLIHKLIYYSHHCRPKVDYFCHPMGLSSSLKSVVGLKEYSDENEAFKVLQSERDPNKEVAKFYINFK